MFLFWLIAASFVYLIVWDQKGRCRTCLRRLRMPVESGSWSKATLFNPPRTESICPYGHGTLEQPEVHTSGKRPPGGRLIAICGRNWKNWTAAASNYGVRQ